MNRRWFFSMWPPLVTVVLVPCALLPAKAGFLSVTPSVSTASLNVGQRYTVVGKVSNVTGVDLRATDVFLSFSGFPFLALEVDQTLGDPDLALPNRSTSTVLALFDVTVLPGAMAGLSYDLEFFGQDINGVFSAPETIAFRINAPQGLPESGTLLLGLSACAAAIGAGRRRSNCPAMRRPPTAILGFTMAATLSPVAANLVLGDPAVSHVAGSLSLNIPVLNVGELGVGSLLCTNITLGTAFRSSPVGFPIVIGQLAASNSVRVAARFADSGLVVGNRYLLTVRGSYVVNGVVYGLAINRYVQVPPVTVPANPSLRARVEVSTSTNYWNYRLVNVEPTGSSQFLTSLALNVFAPVTVTGTPTGWQVETDNASYVLWSAADFVLPYPNQVAPGAALGGFQLMSPRLGSEATAFSLAGWNHITDDAGLILGDYTLTPNRFS